MPQEICQICSESLSEFTNLKCGHHSCDQCLVNWVEAQFERQFAQPLQKVVIKCPQECTHSYDFVQLTKAVNNPESKETLQKLYLQKYLKMAPDLRFCPHSQCKYAGIISVNERCRGKLVCQGCGGQWRDPGQITRMEQIQNLGIGTLSRIDSVSNLKKILKTNACPQCEVPIEKNQGCQMMRCSSCQFQFCWYCLTNYAGYSHKFPDSYCQHRSNYLAWTYIVLFILSYVRICAFSWIMQTINGFILCTIFVALYTYFLLLPLIIIDSRVTHFCIKHSFYKKWSSLRAGFTILSYFTLLGVLIYSYFYGSLFTDGFLGDAAVYNFAALSIICLPKIVVTLLRSLKLVRVIRCECLCFTKLATLFSTRMRHINKWRRVLKHKFQQSIGKMKRRLCRRKKKKSRQSKKK